MKCAKLRASRASVRHVRQVSAHLCFVRVFYFLRALPTFFFYVPLFFMCLTCPNFLRTLRAFIFLRAYILVIYMHGVPWYMLIKFIQINKHLSTFIKNYFSIGRFRPPPPPPPDKYSYEIDRSTDRSYKYSDCSFSRSFNLEQSHKGSSACFYISIWSYLVNLVIWLSVKPIYTCGKPLLS